MQTSLPEVILATRSGQRADEILRSCVHCGFCNATCPTYRLLGDELDGPRGRIYLIKEMLEQQTVGDISAAHLDRCLTCRACETTCPSGVAYGELLEIGRAFQAQHHGRPLTQRLLRNWLVRVLPNPRSFRRWSALGRLVRPLLGRRLARGLVRKKRRSMSAMAMRDIKARVLLLDGCVQRVSTPGVNDRLENLLATQGVGVIRHPAEGCCGGLALHLGRESEARAAMAMNLDNLAGVLDEVEAIVSTASGCGVTLKDYGRYLQDDRQRAEVAQAFAAKVVDVGEYLWRLGGEWTKRTDVTRVALHSPCTLQHGQHRGEFPALLLEAAGYELVAVPDAHLCCGSAGSYSVLEPELAERLAAAKIAGLCENRPDVIATSNVGCQLHLTGRAESDVLHWLELLVPESVHGGEPGPNPLG